MSSRYVIDGSRGTRYVRVSPSLSVMPGARFLPTQSPTDVHAEQVGTRSLADGSNRYRVIPRGGQGHPAGLPDPADERSNRKRPLSGPLDEHGRVLDMTESMTFRE